MNHFESRKYQKNIFYSMLGLYIGTIIYLIGILLSMLFLVSYYPVLIDQIWWIQFYKSTEL